MMQFVFFITKTKKRSSKSLKMLFRVIGTFAINSRLIVKNIAKQKIEEANSLQYVCSDALQRYVYVYANKNNAKNGKILYIHKSDFGTQSRLSTGTTGISMINKAVSN